MVETASMDGRDLDDQHTSFGRGCRTNALVAERVTAVPNGSGYDTIETRPYAVLDLGR